MAPSTGMANGALQRTLGVYDLTALGVGGIVGAGVYSISGTAAALYAGPAVTLSFLISAVACSFSALCYAELSAMIPSSGSAYAFTSASMGKIPGFFLGWDLALEYLLGASTVAVAWSGYLSSLLKDMGVALPDAVASSPFDFDVRTQTWRRTASFINLPAVFITVASTALQIRGMRESARVNNAIVVLKCLVLVVFVLACLPFVSSENYTPFVPPAGEKFGEYGASGVVVASSTLVFAFIGFDSISTAAAEAKDPQRSVPIATLASLGISSALYVAVALVMTGVCNYTQLNVPDPIAVALDAAGDSLTWLRPIVKLGALLGLTSVVMVQILGQARILFAMAQDGLLPSRLAAVHPRFSTPHAATLVTGTLGCVLSGLFPIDILGELVSIGTLAAFLLVSAGVIVLRRTAPNARRPFRISGRAYPAVPVLGVVCAGVQMCALPLGTWLRLLGWMGVGLATYVFYSRKHATGTSASAKHIQLADEEEGGTGGGDGSAGGAATARDGGPLGDETPSISAPLAGAAGAGAGTGSGRIPEEATPTPPAIDSTLPPTLGSLPGAAGPSADQALFAAAGRSRDGRAEGQGHGLLSAGTPAGSSVERREASGLRSTAAPTAGSAGPRPSGMGTGAHGAPRVAAALTVDDSW